MLRTVVALESDPEIGALRAAFWEARFAGSAAIVSRAVTRGELPEGTDAHEVVEELVSPAYFRAKVIPQEYSQLSCRSVELVLRRCSTTEGQS